MYLDDSGKRKGAMVGELNAQFGGDNERKAVIQWITGKTSTSEWSDATWLAFKDWLNMQQVDGLWWPEKHVPQEAKALVKQAMKSQGQQEMEL